MTDPGSALDPTELELLTVLLVAGVLAMLAGVAGGPRIGAGRRFGLFWLEMLAAVAVAVVAFLWGRHLNPVPHPGDPSMYLPVVDCLISEQCSTKGEGSSVMLNNGAVWPDLLVASRMLGFGPVGVYDTVIGMMAAAVGLVLLMTSRFATATAAGPAATLALALASVYPLASPPMDASVPFLFSAAAAASLLVFVITGRSVALVTAGGFLSHALNGHVCAVALLPALLFIPAVAGRSGWRSAMLALGTFMVFNLSSSWGATVGNWDALRFHGVLLWSILGSAGILAAGLLLNARYQRLSLNARVTVLAVFLIAPFGAGTLYLIALDHPFRSAYLPALIAPLAVVSALLLGWPFRRLLRGRLGQWASFLAPMMISLYLLHCTLFLLQRAGWTRV